MKIIEVIRAYDRMKSTYQPMPAGLSQKLVQLMAAFGHLDTACSGQSIMDAALAYWPSAKPNTLARMLNQLRAILRHGQKAGMIQAVPHIIVPSYYDVRETLIGPEEVELLLDHIQLVDRKWYPLILVLSHSGPRLGEALRLAPSDVGDSYITFRKKTSGRSKTVQRRVPMTPRIRANAHNIMSHIACHGSLSVAGVAPSSVKGCMRNSLRSACEALSLPMLRIHDVRHAFAGVVAHHGGDISDIASSLGHEKIATSFRYRGLVASKLSVVLGAVGSNK